MVRKSWGAGRVLCHQSLRKSSPSTWKVNMFFFLVFIFNNRGLSILLRTMWVTTEEMKLAFKESFLRSRMVVWATTAFYLLISLLVYLLLVLIYFLLLWSRLWPKYWGSWNRKWSRGPGGMHLLPCLTWLAQSALIQAKTTCPGVASANNGMPPH